MSNDGSRNIQQQVRMAQLIVAALIVGIVMFSGIAFVVGQGGEPKDEPLVTYIAAGVGGLVAVMRYVVPGIIAKAQIQQIVGDRKEARPADLLPAFIAKTILENALPEAACLFALVAFIIESQMFAFALVGVLLALIAVGFPTRDRFESWANNQLQMLEMRQG